MLCLFWHLALCNSFPRPFLRSTWSRKLSVSREEKIQDWTSAMARNRARPEDINQREFYHKLDLNFHVYCKISVVTFQYSCYFKITTCQQILLFDLTSMVFDTSLILKLLLPSGFLPLALASYILRCQLKEVDKESVKFLMRHWDCAIEYVFRMYFSQKKKAMG